MNDVSRRNNSIIMCVCPCPKIRLDFWTLGSAALIAFFCSTCETNTQRPIISHRLTAKAISGSIILNSAKCRVVCEFSALNVKCKTQHNNNNLINIISSKTDTKRYDVVVAGGRAFGIDCSKLHTHTPKCWTKRIDIPQCTCICFGSKLARNLRWGCWH